ncbi:FimV/HubP family polar landmark protein [Psychromonas sp. MME2]|uniref:FimV/HubP family polar landmark protein n=1 Tax=unclassified Psychromonas TaxID=2614957 RepID=UPI00339BB66E
MKRLLLTLVCCSSLIFSAPQSFALDLTGPNGETATSNGQYGPITTSETLWSIASKLRPSDRVSIQQTLLGIYKLNPNAFFNGNINRPIASSNITIPTLDFVLQQTDREAMALINKYTPKPNVTVNKAKSSVTPAKKNTKPEAQSVAQAPQKNEKSIIAQKAVDEALKEELLVVKNELIALQVESVKQQNSFNSLQEDLLVETEKNQKLIQIIDPLREELSSTQAALEAELANNKALQITLADYRAQLDAVAARPFSGEGLFNEVLRWITSSLTNLLLVIFFPILLLLAIFVIISRMSVKKSLAEQNEELAQSTSMLMEEHGKFDSLLTEDIFAEGESEQEIDFSAQESAEPETINIDDDEENDFSSELQHIDLEEIIPGGDTAPETMDVDLDNSDVDPFGINELVENESLSTINLDDDEPAHDEDDPFGIAALVNAEDLISNDDLDLAAEWEAQLAEEDSNVKQNDVTEQDEWSIDSAVTSPKTDEVTQPEVISENITDPDMISDLLESTQSSNAKSVSTELDDLLAQEEQEQADIDDLLAQAQPDETDIDDLLAQAQTDEADIDDLLAQVPSDEADIDDLLAQAPSDEADIDDLLAQAPSDEADIDDLLAQAQSDEADADDLLAQAQSDESDIDDLLAQAQTDDADIDDLLAQAQTDDADIDDLLAQAQSDEADIDDLLAQAQSDEADIDDLLSQAQSDEADIDDLLAQAQTDQDEIVKKNDFIDIETLMEDSEQSNNKEDLYDEFDLDFGLDEFPDVINAESDIDIDDDENGVSAQLDLARAYLEIDDKKGAKEILLSILNKSNPVQRVEIEKLIQRIE